MLMNQRINVVKIYILPKPIYKFNAVSVKILRPFFTKTNIPILKYIWKHETARRAKTTLNT